MIVVYRQVIKKKKKKKNGQFLFDDHLSNDLILS